MVSCYVVQTEHFSIGLPRLKMRKKYTRRDFLGSEFNLVANKHHSHMIYFVTYISVWHFFVIKSFKL